MKNLFKLFSFVILLFLGQSVFAEDYNSSCGSLITSTNNNSQEIMTARKSYSEVMGCTVSVLPKTISIQMLHSLFDEPVLKAMNVVVALIPNTSDLSISEYDISKEALDGNYVFTEFGAIMQALSNIVYYIIMVLIGIYYTYYIVNTAKEGNFLGENNNAFWTLAKLVFTLFLLTPVESFNNYALIQVIILMVIIAAVILATITWLSIPLYESVYSNNFDNVFNSMEYQKMNEVSEFVEQNIELQICDIQKRKSILLSKFPIEDLTIDNISNSEYGACLENEFETKRITKSFQTMLIPKELVKTKTCSEKLTSEDTKVDCGALYFKQNNIESIDLNADYKNAIYTTTLNMASQVSEGYQDEVRKVAEDIIAHDCVTNKIDQRKSNPFIYYLNCSKVNKNIEYEEGKIATYNEGDLLSVSEINDKITALKNTIFQKHRENAETTMQVLGITVNSGLQDSNSFQEEVKKEIFRKLSMGWLASSTILLDLSKIQYEKDLLAESSFSVFSVKNKDALKDFSSDVSYLDVTTFGDSSLQVHLDNKELNETKNIIFSNNEFISSESFEVGKLLKSILFPALNSVEKFNGKSELLSNRTEQKTCQESYAACAIVSINPLIDMVKTGQKIIASSSNLGLISALVAAFSNKYADGSIAIIAQMFTYLFTLNGLVGAIMAYFIPVLIISFFIGNVIGWFASILEAMAVSQIWVALHLVPSREEGFAGHAKNGYNLLLSILVRPAFIVFGVLVTFILFSVFLAVLNVLFGIVLETFTFFQSPNTPLEMIYTVILQVIYICFVLLVSFRASKAIYKIPNSLLNWLSFKEDGESGVFGDVFALFKKIGLNKTNIRMLLIIS